MTCKPYLSDPDDMKIESGYDFNQTGYFAISSFLYFKIMVPNSNFSKASSDIRIII